MALRVASMVGDAPAVDCELMAAAETWSHDTKLSRSDGGTGMLVGISRQRLYK
jgi:hypothetical protein